MHHTYKRESFRFIIPCIARSYELRGGGDGYRCARARTCVHGSRSRTGNTVGWKDEKTASTSAGKNRITPCAPPSDSVITPRTQLLTVLHNRAPMRGAYVCLACEYQFRGKKSCSYRQGDNERNSN